MNTMPATFVGETNSQYNTAETRGGRVAGLLNVGDNWTISPLFMGQILDSQGFFGYDPAAGDLNVMRFGPPGERSGFLHRDCADGPGQGQ
jgi:hypothetical protein